MVLPASSVGHAGSKAPKDIGGVLASSGCLALEKLPVVLGSLPPMREGVLKNIPYSVKVSNLPSLFVSTGYLQAVFIASLSVPGPPSGL